MASSTKKNGQETVAALRVALEVTEDTPVYYVNYAEVGHSQYELSIAVTRVPTKIAAEVLADAKKTGELKLDAALQLLLPPAVIEGLITALQTQLEAYKKTATAVASSGS